MSADILSRVSEVLIQNGVLQDQVEKSVNLVRNEYRANSVYVRARPDNFDQVVVTEFNKFKDTKIVAKRTGISRATVYNILKRNRKCHSR